ncbi:MAG TPA: bifunctional serine/threonine-protein kinase/ABC transporter substrate-binding protein [Planctomycetota bacterium]|nr:bifunctional serine/threonine-protein kinase/ABC transporter substrate-binding protein [Planctomycetota bacterium]HRU50994.1 bifunctional serine/threonine-protein kinase/ABC transporter substrate-binding protein [Planctomycetota bacterium]
MLPKNIGRYKVLNEIGHGGMGKVLDVYDPVLCRRVAMKILLHPKNVFQNKEHFMKEAQNIARLRHPHIITVYDVGEDQDQIYFTMPIIQGESLSSLLSQKKISVQDGIRLLVKIVDAVAYAHSQGIIHRDIKPSNIMIQSNGEPILMDFGLAKEVMTISQHQETVGTPTYMAPEQLKGKVEFQSDVYSLGAILYEILTSQPPFSSDTSVQILAQVLEKEPLSPIKVNPEIDKKIDAICRKAMAKSLKVRYQNATRFFNDLQNYLQNQNCEASIDLSNLWKFILGFIILIAGLCFWLFFLESPKRVLLVFSYEKDILWDIHIRQAILETFENHLLRSDKEIVVRDFYINAKKESEEEKIQSKIHQAIHLIRSWRPHLVITIDDLATGYITPHFFHSSIQFVFCGVNNDIKEYGFPQKNVTGICEDVFVKQTFQKIDTFLPTAKNYVILIEDTPIASEMLQHIHQELETIPLYCLETFCSANWEEWKQCLKQYESQVDFFYIPMYHNLKDEQGNYISSADVLQWILGNIEKPFLGLLDFNIKQGALFGVVATGKKQGEIAGYYGVQILKGKTADAFPIFHLPRGELYINRKTAKRYNITIPTWIEPYAIIIDE